MEPVYQDTKAGRDRLSKQKTSIRKFVLSMIWPMVISDPGFRMDIFFKCIGNMFMEDSDTLNTFDNFKDEEEAAENREEFISTIFKRLKDMSAMVGLHTAYDKLLKKAEKEDAANEKELKAQADQVMLDSMFKEFLAYKKSREHVEDELEVESYIAKFHPNEELNLSFAVQTEDVYERVSLDLRRSTRIKSSTATAKKTKKKVSPRTMFEDVEISF